MARSKPSKHRRPSSPRPLRGIRRLFGLHGEPLESRLLLSGNDPTPSLDADYANSPMSFQANLGQVDSRARFISRGEGYELFLTSRGAVLSLPPAAGTAGGAAAASVLSMELVGASPTAAITGVDELAAKSNYLRGGAQSITGVPNYAGVAYQDVYPGVGLEYHGSGKQLEYDFTVAAGADPSAVRLRFTGASGMELDAQGDLLLHTVGGDIVEHAPALYQGDGADRQAVAGGYSIDDGTVGFTIGPYDAARPLVIDPVLAYSTYLGNAALSTFSQGAVGNAIATDGKGNAYVTGAVLSSAFPTIDGGTSGAPQKSFNAEGYDAFVTELDAAGQIVFSTYLGGNPDESGEHEVTDDQGYTETVGYQSAANVGDAIAVDKSGNVYITGSTWKFTSDGFLGSVIGFIPTVHAFQPQYGGGNLSDAFVAKLDPTGGQLIYSSYLHDPSIDPHSIEAGFSSAVGTGIAADASGNAYVVGDIGVGSFVAKINSDASLAYYENFNGGQKLAVTDGAAIAADSKGNVYFTGSTDDAEFASTPLAGALGRSDVYVAHLDPTGGVFAVVRLGGQRDDSASGIALDAGDNVYLTGATDSLDFPTTEHAFQKDKPRNVNYVPNAFVTKLSSDLSEVLYSTYLGGSTPVSAVVPTPSGTETIPRDYGDSGDAIGVDTNGAAYVVGRTASADFPTANAVQTAHAAIEFGNNPPHNDAFVAKLDPGGSNLVYSTYLGGSGQDAAYGVAVDRLGNAYVVGTTDSTDFRTTAGAPQETFTREPAARDVYFQHSSPNDFYIQTSAFVVRLAPPLSVEALPIDAVIGQPFSGPVAKFTAPFFELPANPITATVNWGDGSSDETSDIRREGGPGTAFDVFDSSHAYLKLGAFPVVVTVHDADATTNANVSQLAGNQSETTIAINPLHPEQLFVASNNDSPPTPANAGVGIFAAFSQDGGKSWTPSDFRDHLIGDGDDELTPSGGDPKAVFDQFGNLFLVYINAQVNGVVLVVSTDGGKTFMPLRVFADGGSVDQPSVAVGPGLAGAGGSVWVTFQSNMPTPHINAVGAAVSGPVSGPGGIGNIDAFLPVATAPGPTGSAAPVDGNFGGLDVGPNGQVLVSYMDNTGSAGPATIFVSLDPDGLGSTTFNPAVAIPTPASPPGSHTTTTNVGGVLRIPAQEDIDAKPRLAWDRSLHSSHKGRVYLSYIDSADVGNQNTRIVVRSSDDNGVTWSDPTEVTPDNGASAFWPSIFVDQTNGDVGVSWYDTRNVAPANTQLFGAISSDGGVTFSPNVQISLGTSNHDNVVQNPTKFRDIDYGDYEGAVFHNGFFYPSWADNSTELGANPDVPNYDVAVARIAVAHVSAPTPKVTVSPPNIVEGQTPQGAIAKFTDPDPDLSASDFTVTVDWADGSKPDSVTPTGDAATGYTVPATHTYAEEGGYPVQVTVHDDVHDLSGSTTNALNISKLPGNQDEGTIAINPKDAKQLFAASNDEGQGLFAAYSTDGGDSWTARTIADGADGLTVACCDPIAAFDQYGNLFLTYLDFTKKVIVVALSSDGGQTFSELTSFSDAAGIDKPSLATGPGPGGKDGSVWIAYQNDSPTSEISVVGAAVNGAASALGPDAIGPFGTPQAIVQTPANLAYVAVGAAGQVVAIYETFTEGGPSTIYASLNATGNPGAFGPPSKVADTNVSGQLVIPAQAERKIQAGANVAIDNTDVGHQGRIYVVYTDSDAVDSLATNIFVRYSDDEAKTWSDPVKVNDDLSASSKFFPSIAVDQSTGNVGVAWYDTRNDPDNVKTQFFAAVSTQGGNDFSTNIQVSPGSSDATDPGLNGSAILNQYGDYTGLAFSQNVLYPLWADNSTELQDNTDRPQFEQAIAKINVANVSDAPLRAQALDISDDVGAEGEVFTTDVASFTDADPHADAALYTATIDWGDNTTLEAGEIRNENGTFFVAGTHAYKEEGSYSVTVSIDDKGGASAKVTLDTDVEDADLVAVGPTFRPAEGLSFSGVVATFTDGNLYSQPNGKFGDYNIPTINWGDGTATDGEIVFDGSAALTAWSGHNGFLAIGNAASGDRSLIGLDAVTSTTTPLMPLSADFYGGLAEGPNLDIYALSNNGAGESSLNLLNLKKQTIQPMAYLGSGFTGGLAFDGGDGQFYAIADAAGSSTFYGIDAKTFAARAIGNIETHAYAGLTYAGGGKFYATAADADGKSKLYRIDLIGLGAGLTFSTLDISLGSGFTGGLAESNSGGPSPFGLLGGLVGLSNRANGSAFLNAISLTQGVVAPAYEIPNFNNGFAIVGTHTYAVEGPQTVTVEIRDIGGSAAIATSTAQVVDEPPIPQSPPPAVSVFQGFASGPVALGSFELPHGAEVGPTEYSASVDWGDGGNPETALVAVSGSTITVSSAGHTYRQAGASEPGAKTGEFHPLVTLTDDTGNSATLIDTVDVAPDVSPQLKVVGLGGPLNPATGLFTSSGTITNLSAAIIPGPLYIIVHGLPAGVALANAKGTMFSGEPFYVLGISQLNAGQTSTAVNLVFRDAALKPFTYSLTVIDGPVGDADPAGAIAASGDLAAGFVANVGQTNTQARYVAQGDGATLFLTSSGAVLSLLAPGNGGDRAPTATATATALGLQFVGANPAAVPVGLDPLAAATNYLIGNDPSKWRSNVPSFGRVEYRDIYPGITLDYHSSSSERLEYDFTVAAGADPGLIRLDFQGTDSMAIDAAGNLVLHTAAGDVIEQAPVIYQETGGARQAIAGAYEMGADGQVGFRIGSYDRDAPLVIDPVLVYSTYLGGSKLDVGTSVATDAAGNTYIAGYSYSPEFPNLAALGPPPDRLGQPSLSGGGPIAFVTKLDPTGAVVYSTFLGGNGLFLSLFGLPVTEGDQANAIAVDAAGEVYVTGSTYSLDFPTVNALASETDVAGFSNGFVAKLAADGSRLLFSTYLTGTHDGSGIALDADGNAYIAGTIGGSFPLTVGAAQTQVAGGFVEKLSADGDRVLYAAAVPGTVLSGTEGVSGTVKGIAVNSTGEAYIVGDTNSGGGPVLAAAQAVYGGGTDAFVAKLNAAGSGLLYWTYLGGSQDDHGNAIALDAAGDAYVVGSTMSGNFPTAQAVQASFGGTTDDRVAVDAFVTKLSPDGSTRVYSTYLGGSGPDRATGIAIDGAGNAYVTGQTGSANFPIEQALQPTFRGDGRPETTQADSFDLGSGRGDAFVTRINASGTALDYSTYLGGSGLDAGNAIAVSPAGDAVVTGATTSLDFPTLNALQAQPGILSGTTIRHNEVGTFFIVPASTVGRTELQIPTAFVARIAAQGAGVLQLANVPFQPVEGVAFTGIVASFTDTDTDTSGDYTANIDWGDGVTSAGVVTSDSANGFGFVVSGAHTYAEEGAYPVIVSVHDADGSVASISQTTFGQNAGGPVTYRVSVDTSSLAGTSGFLDFQLNPGALPDAQSAGATIENFRTVGGSIGGVSTTGGASGDLSGAAVLGNAAVLNELKQGFTFGASLSFDIRLEGDALTLPGRGLFGSTFALRFLAADGGTPVDTTAVDGAALRISVYPDGGTQLSANAPHVTAAAVNAVTVADAPLTTNLVPIDAIEGTPFAGTVASFTDANPAATPTDFTANILWGDGSAATAGTIVADGNANFHVTGEHTYVEAGAFDIRVVVRDSGGSVGSATDAAAGKTQISGLQAPRVAFAGTGLTGGQPVSFASGDFNGDGKPDLAIWHNAPAGPLLTTLDVLLGNGDGSFQAPITAISNATQNSLVIAIADFNGDGKLDIASNDTLLLGNGDGTFQAGKVYDGGAPNVGLAVADFNGDGIPDLAVANGFGLNGPNPGVRILLGNGDGTFGSETTYFDDSASTGISLVAGDFNGDGKPDLVFSAAIGGSTVLFVNRGDGVFDQNLPVASGFTVNSAADLNGDGKLDLVGTGGGKVLVLTGKGNGAFSDPISYVAGEQPSLVTVGDFNGDGVPDLAVDDAGQNSIGAGVSVLNGIGDGTFAASLTFPTPGFLSGGGGIGSESYAAADFNGDGSLDLAIQTPTTVSILFGHGDGSVVDDRISPSGEWAVHVAPADFNGDGHVDLALTEGFFTFGPNVLLGNGNGSFQTAGVYPAASPGPAALSADFNGDGFPDVVDGNQLLLGRGDGTYLPALDLNFGGWLPVGQADFNHDGHPDLVTEFYDFNTGADTVGVFLGGGDGTFRFAGSFTGSERDASLAIADMNGDGIDDVVIGRDSSVAVLLGNADGSLQAPLIYPIANQFSFRVAVGDFNGDGKLDVAAASNGVNILLGKGDGSLQAPTNYDPGFSPFNIATADFNGDGKLDLIGRILLASGEGAVRVLSGNGDGSFADGVTISTGIPSNGVAMVTGDFNGDGRTDFAVGGDQLLVVLGNGDGTFQPGVGYAAAGFDPSAGTAGLTASDVNRDGRTDLLAADSDGVRVYLGQPGGVLLGARGYAHQTSTVQAADLNGDGRPELMGIEHTLLGPFEEELDKLYVLLNKGDGTFPQFVEYDLRGAGDQNQGAIIHDMVEGDFNGDGIVDLVADAGLSIGAVRAVLLGNGDGTFRTPQITSVSTFSLVEKLLARDVNGDGKLDLVAVTSDFDGSYLQVNLGNGDGTFQNAIRTGALANVNISGFGANSESAEGFATADFNGDGKLDAAIGTVDHSINIYPGNGDGTFAPPITSAVNLLTTAFATGDLNGDGKADLVTANVDGTVSLLIGNGDGTFQKPITYLVDGKLDSGTNISFDPLALNDLNGDGVLDVVFGGSSQVASLLNQPVLLRQNVADAPLIATPLDHRATQGVPMTAIVARFTDANHLATLDDFSAMITWGDGQTSSGVIEADLNGGFLVVASKTYAQTGTYSAVIAITDRDGSAVSVQSTITVTGISDAALTAVSVPVAAMARAPFSGVVATFVDADPAGSAQDFTATILWGDGQTSPGFVRPAANGFEVVGAHTYTDVGSYVTGIAIIDTGGATAAVTGSAVVAANTDLPITPSSITFHATEQTTFSGIVASFTDADSTGQAADYTASVDWGDGTTSSGTISPDPTVPGQFDVIATHGYHSAGSFFVAINVVDREGATATAQSTAVVEDAPLGEIGRRVTATEGAAFKGVVASFGDANPFSAAVDFTATIAWGDGQVSTGTITADRLIPGRFNVTGVNSYAEEGVFPVEVTIADIGGAAATVRSIANVTDAPLVATGATVQAAEAVAFTTVIATFHDNNPGGSADEYTAVIVWGDGRTSLGSVTPGASGGFDVSGSHSYAVAGTYAARVSLVDRGGANAVADVLVDVAGAVVQGTPQLIQATEGALFAGVVASFTSEGAVRGPGDFLASIDWGDGQTSAGTIVQDLATGQFEISGSTTYAEESGIYGDSVTVTIADHSGVLATIQATASVADAPLTATAAVVHVTQAEPFTGALATFTDADPAATVGDYIAYVSFGKQFASGTITADPQVAGRFDVSAALTFADLGSFPVTIYLYDRGNSNTSVQSTVVVRMVPTAAGTSSLAQAGVSFNTVVATIDDENPGEKPGDFTANIDWGDGRQSHGLVSFDPDNPSVFRVLGSSTYTKPGSYSVTADLLRSDGLPLTAASTIDVSAALDASLSPLPGTLIATQVNTAVKHVVATFLDADLTSTAADFTATIHWGDGGSSAGIVVANPAAAGIFSILGDHTYAAAGVNLAAININDIGGATAAAIATVVVSANETLLLPTNTALSSDFTSGSTYGQTVAFTATVSATGATPTGSVDFVDQTTGQDLGATLLAIVNGVSEASVMVSGLAAVSHTIVASYTSDTSGLENSQDSLTQVVSPAMLTVTAGDKAKIYGSANPALTDTLTGFVNGDAASVVSGSASLNTPATAASGVGNYTITAGPGTLRAANYTFEFANGKLTVTPATLTVTADDNSKIYGSANPPLTDTITGFVNGDAATVVSGSANLSTPATAASGVGSYTITIDQGSLSAANYTFVFVNGTLTVTDSAAQETLNGVGLAVDGFELSPLVDVAIATFMSSKYSEPANAFAVTIHWGDGASSPGTVSLSGSQFTVSGSHVYTDEGQFSIMIDVADAQALTTIAATAKMREELLREGTPGSAEQQYISEIYRDVLGRQAEPQGRDFWVSHLDRGDGRTKVAEDILAAVTEEYHVDLIRSEFIRYLHRAPEPAGMQYFTSLLDTGGNAGLLDAIIVSSPEYFDAHGGVDGQFLDALFSDALQRPVDSTARSFFDGLLAKGADRAAIADVIFTSEEYRRDVVVSWYEQYLDRTADAAGVAPLVAQLGAGVPAERIIAMMLASDEFLGKTN